MTDEKKPAAPPGPTMQQRVLGYVSFQRETALNDCATFAAQLDAMSGELAAARARIAELESAATPAAKE